jgi:hypothetical protein
VTEDDTIEANSFFRDDIQYAVGQAFPGREVNHERDMTARLSAGSASQYFLLLQRETGRDTNFTDKTGTNTGPIDPLF